MRSRAQTEVQRVRRIQASWRKVVRMDIEPVIVPACGVVWWSCTCSRSDAQPLEVAVCLGLALASLLSKITPRANVRRRHPRPTLSLDCLWCHFRCKWWLATCAWRNYLHGAARARRSGDRGRTFRRLSKHLNFPFKFFDSLCISGVVLMQMFFR